MVTASHWLARIGFQVWQVPGVSRAWCYEFDDGSFLLITDLGGFDLPDASGPYCALWLTSANIVEDAVDCLSNPRQLYRWFRHVVRLQVYRSRKNA